jgi:hypothetical protein
MKRKKKIVKKIVPKTTRKHKEEKKGNVEEGHNLTAGDIINLEKNNIIWPSEPSNYEIWNKVDEEENEIAKKISNIRRQTLI